MRISTRSSSSRPNAVAGAGLRIVVAPAARARWKKTVTAGSGISNWLTAMSPFASAGATTSAALTNALAPGMTTMAVAGIGDRNDRRSGVGLGRFPHKTKVDPLRGEERPQLTTERVHPDPADQRDLCAEFGGGHRLVGAVAAGKIKHRVAGDGFADAGMPVGRGHHIHVDAAGNEDAAHALLPDHALTENSRLTASMSASAGNPGSLPSRWIL